MQKRPIKNPRDFGHDSEIEFIRFYFTHKNWIYHPCQFRLNNGKLEKYEPDFYDKETNTFIEVVGTTQAFYANKRKYIDFKNAYPLLNFEIRYKDGTLIDINNPHITIKENNYKKAREIDGK